LATITQTATVVKTARAQTLLNVQSQIQTTAFRIQQGNSDLSSIATVEIQSVRIRESFVNALVEFTVNASGDRSRSGFINIQSDSNLSVDFDRFRSVDLQFDAIATQLSVAAINATGTVLLEAVARLDVDAVKTTDQPIYLFSEFTKQVTATKTVSANIDIQTQTTVNADISKFLDAVSDLTATATITADTEDSLLLGAIVQVQSNFDISIGTDNSRIRNVVSNNTSNFTLQAQALRIKRFEADLLTIASSIVITGIRASAQANLQVTGFVLTAGDVINFDPFLTLKIKQETRGLIIDPENRVISIEQETRLNIIQGY
jgi:hypothetical protein